MVFYILSITTIAPKFGIGNAVFFVLIGQLASAAVIDHFAFFAANPNTAFHDPSLGHWNNGSGRLDHATSLKQCNRKVVWQPHNPNLIFFW